MLVPFPSLARLFALFLFATLASLASAQPGPEAEEAAAQISPQDVQSLLNTLEDPLAREAFLERLRTLATVQDEAAAEDEAEDGDLGVTLLAAASLGVDELSEHVDVIVGYLQQAPATVENAWNSLMRPEAQRTVLEIAVKVVGIFIASLLAAFLVRRMLARPWDSLQTRQARNAVDKSVMLLGSLLLRAIPLVAFAATAYLVLPLLDPRPITRLVLLTLVNAHVIGQGVITAARILLAVDAPHLRPYRMADHTAAYAYVWLRRLAIVIVYGYFISEALLLAGLEPTLHTLLVDLTGFFVALLFVSLILQNRHTVAAAIRGGDDVTGVMAQVRGTAAMLWHLLAIAYVVGVFVVWAFEVEGGFYYLLSSTLNTLVVIVLARLALLGLEKGMTRLFHIPEHMRDRYTGLEERAGRYRPIISKIIKGLLLVIAAMAILEAWGIEATAFLATDLGSDLVTRLARLLFIVGFSILAWELISAVIEKRLKSGAHSSRRTLTLLPLLKNVVRLVIVVLGSMIALSEIGVNIGPLLASAGVIGLAIGFGAQTLVRDLITGFFVILEDIIAVGDWVEVGGHSGMVESMTIRTLRLRDLDGNLRILPFGDVSSVHKVASDFSFALVVIRVAYREDIDEVAALLKGVGEEMREDPEWKWRILEPLEYHGVVELGASSVNLRMRFKCRPLEQWGVQREYLRRAKRKLDEHGVEIPFPHQTVYFGENRPGKTPAGRLVVERSEEILQDGQGLKPEE